MRFQSQKSPPKRLETKYMYPNCQIEKQSDQDSDGLVTIQLPKVVIKHKRRVKPSRKIYSNLQLKNTVGHNWIFSENSGETSVEKTSVETQTKNRIRDSFRNVQNLTWMKSYVDDFQKRELGRPENILLPRKPFNIKVRRLKSKIPELTSFFSHQS